VNALAAQVFALFYALMGRFRYYAKLSLLTIKHTQAFVMVFEV